MCTKTSSHRLQSKFQTQFGERVRFSEPLAPYVAYKVGGPADILVFPKDENDLFLITKLTETFQLPITIIGNGTNLLVRDEGIRGVTVSLHHAFKGIEILKENSNSECVRVQCGGGVEKPELLEWAIQNKLTGLEFSSGVPGTIGGGIYMNAGTKYGCYGDILKKIRLFDFENGPKNYSRSEFEMGYRGQSIVTSNTLVLWAEFELRQGKQSEIRTTVERIIGERAAKQPLEFPSCGSTFKNPVGFSAGRLVEKAGLKGRQIGGAQISEKHANFILNKGGATASDILGLIKLAKTEVKRSFGVELECEVVVVGS